MHFKLKNLNLKKTAVSLNYSSLFHDDNNSLFCVQSNLHYVFLHKFDTMLQKYLIV